MSTSPPISPLLSIADVERDTGLGKDTLRVWERRYGFPTPARDDQGQRMYTQADVDRLRQIAALLRAGHRPGRVVVLDDAQRQALLNPYPPGEGTDAPPNATGHGRESAAVQALLDTVTHRDGLALRRQLQQSLTRLGLSVFVTDLMAPLTTAVGQAWLRGELGVADEHLFTEVAHGILRQGLMSLPEPVPGAAPRVLLTTLPGEPHGLGLLMAEAMCALSGAWCVNLGPQTPIDEIVAAAGWHRAQVVGLSATGCLPVRWLRQGLDQLRQRLPAGTLLWLGGSAGDMRRAPGIVRITDLRAIAPAIAALPPPSSSVGSVGAADGGDPAGAPGR